MDKQREEFEAWFKKKFNDLHEAICCGDFVAKNYKKAMWKTWQASSIPDRNILVNKGDYVELVKTNRERQETIARLTEEVKILRERKKFYKNKCKASSIPDGYVVVPKDPTKRMIDAGVDNTPETPSQDYWHSSQPLDDEQAEACYKAMIEAVD